LNVIGIDGVGFSLCLCLMFGGLCEKQPSWGFLCVVIVVLGGGDCGGELARTVVMTPAGACGLGDQ
jgi:hypothetical protein